MGTLEIEGLTKQFDDDGKTIVAVDDIDINVKDGDFLVLVGPSGCGKTTTLRCIGGLEKPSEGDIRLNGESIVDKSPQSRDIAMVFQDYALYPHMTARENMSFGLKMNSNLSSDEIKRQVMEVAKMMGIEELLGKKPRELSGGQQQRVALGRAIVRDPEVFLMDEPLSNLDAKLRRQMRTEIQNLQQTLQTTTVYVTHDQTEAMTMGDSIAILDGGEVQQYGTPLECYHMPANSFVASFIGSPSMNFMECSKTGEILEGGEVTYELSDSLAAEMEQTSNEVTIGIRPSDVELASPDETNAIATTVNVTEPLGDVTYVYVTLNEEEFIFTVDGERTIRDGETIYMYFPEDKLHVFDQATGETIRNRIPPEDEEQLIQV